MDDHAEGSTAVTKSRSARRILRGQRMPAQEIRAVLAADDPLVARQLLELHRERLGEWYEEQRGLVASIERSLADGAAVRPRRRASRACLSEVAAG
jgi:hypothetical protein